MHDGEIKSLHCYPLQPLSWRQSRLDTPINGKLASLVRLHLGNDAHSLASSGLTELTSIKAPNHKLTLFLI